MKSYPIRDITEEFTCPYCGIPLWTGDIAIDDTDNTGECFCSEDCAASFWREMHDEPESKEISDGQHTLCAAYSEHLLAEINLARHSKA